MYQYFNLSPDPTEDRTADLVSYPQEI